MHYDKKIALAMGVLLVGIVAALFFRRGTASEEDVPKLVDAKSLDAKIAEKSVRPYEPPARETPARTAAAEEARPTLTYGGFPSEERISQRGPRRPDNPTRLGPPEPIRTRSSGSAGTVGMIPVPDHNAAWNDGAGPSNPKAGRKSKPAATGYREYRVRKGDTLSAIAARLLGSSLRYREIFEANRDRMRSPNDLRPGILLRIPVRKRPQPPAPGRGVSQTKTAGRGPSGKPLARDRRFVPVRRSPFILGQLLRGNSKSARGSTPPRSTNVRDAPRVPSPRTYVVRRGDSLEQIAVRYYGTRRAVAKILQANRGRIADPSRLYVGTRIVLP